MSTRHRKQQAKRKLDELIQHYAQKLVGSRDSYWRLVATLRCCSRLLIPSTSPNLAGGQRAEPILRACARMAKWWRLWRNEPEGWIPPDANSFQQFRSFAAHLFEHYPAPTFMIPGWLSREAQWWEQELYLHLAAGKSIRKFRLPLPYATRISKRAARFFMQAPDDLYPMAAIRWAEVRSLGGDDRLARILMNTPTLAAPTEHDDFWATVIRFLINHQPIDEVETRAIVQFIDEHRFQPAERIWGHGGELPLQPEFSMRGRTLRSLRRHMANWRLEMLANLPIPSFTARSWTRSDIVPFRWAEDGEIWTIEELLTDKELRVEGHMMQHCVASYIRQCAQRETSIWSMKLEKQDRRKRLLTIEVGPKTKMIWQAKGKRNASPKPKEKEMLRRWAEQAGLQFNSTA